MRLAEARSCTSSVDHLNKKTETAYPSDDTIALKLMRLATKVDQAAAQAREAGWLAGPSDPPTLMVNWKARYEIPRRSSEGRRQKLKFQGSTL